MRLCDVRLDRLVGESLMRQGHLSTDLREVTHVHLNRVSEQRGIQARKEIAKRLGEHTGGGGPGERRGCKGPRDH